MDTINAKRQARASQWPLASLLPALVALQGCSSLTHYNSVRGVETADDQRTEVLLMDAKQRAVFPTYTKVGDKEFRAFCAEPSPDALSALAAQWGATVSVQARGEGSINGSLGEAAGSIGLRTTSIQILRDITYRQCEAYANGGISRLGLETLQRRFQSTMVALLSIEQLTGAVRAPALTLSGKGAANDAKQVAELTQQTEDARAAVTKGETDVAGKQKAANAKADAASALKKTFDGDESRINALKDKNEEDRTAAEKQQIAEWDKASSARAKEVTDAQTTAAAAKTDLADATKTLDERKASFDRIDHARLASLTSGGSASTTAEATPLTVPRALDSDSVKAVSQAVTDIVRDTLSLGYGREVCTSIIGDQTDPGRPKQTDAAKQASDTVLGSCLQLLQADISYYKKLEEQIAARNALSTAVATGITTCASNEKCAANPRLVESLVQALAIVAKEPERPVAPLTATPTR